MAYLNRDQRREMILQAAMQVALAEGFTAMTVRRIATEAQTSTGQVHHHFSEAELLIEQDIEIQQAYNLAMQNWHQTIVQAIECGQKEGEFKNRSNSTDTAWRLIAFVCGLEGIYKLGLHGLAEEDFKRHTEAIIRLELL